MSEEDAFDRQAQRVEHVSSTEDSDFYGPRWKTLVSTAQLHELQECKRKKCLVVGKMGAGAVY
jgi:hypothetical protein